MQRIQLLSNLRALIEVSGGKSRLAANARAAHSEDERLQFVSRAVWRRHEEPLGAERRHRRDPPARPCDRRGRRARPSRRGAASSASSRSGARSTCCCHVASRPKTSSCGSRPSSIPSSNEDANHCPRHVSHRRGGGGATDSALAGQAATRQPDAGPGYGGGRADAGRAGCCGACRPFECWKSSPRPFSSAGSFSR